MSLTEYLTGAGYLVAILGSVGVATALIVRRWRPDLSGVALALALATLATAALAAVHVLPLALGVLSRESVLIVAGLLLAAGLLTRRRGVRPRAQQQVGGWRDEDRFTLATAAVAIFGVAAYVLAYAMGHLTTALSDIDPLAIHLPGVARWIQSGSLWEINSFVPDQAHGDYPNTGDLMLLALLLPFGTDFLVAFAMFPFFAVVGLSAYGIGRELGAERAPSLLFGALVLATPAVIHPAIYQAMPDAVMLATFGSGIYFLLRHARTDLRADLVLAAIGLGIAFGTKWYGVTTVAVVVVTWLAGRGLAARRSRTGVRPLAQDAALVVGLIAAAGGIWMLRNLVESGNPVFPAKISLLGLTVFDAPYDWVRARAGFTIADYAFEPEIWRRYILDAFERTLGLPALLVAAGAAAALVSAVMARRQGGWTVVPARIALAGAAALLIAVAYAFTPYSALGAEGAPTQVDANTRYVAPALPIAAGMAAWMLSRLGVGLRRVLEVAAILAILHGLVRTGRLPIVDSLVAMVALAALGLITASIVRGVRQGRLRLSGSAGFAAAVVLLLGATASGRAMEHRFADERYKGEDPVIDWILVNAPAGHRVGLVGAWTLRGLAPSYPVFGPRLENHVAYVGPFIDGMLRNYGGRASFVRGLRRGRFDLLVVGRGFLEVVPEVREERWAKSAGWRSLARSERLTLYGVPRARGRRTSCDNPRTAGTLEPCA